MIWVLVTVIVKLEEVFLASFCMFLAHENNESPNRYTNLSDIFFDQFIEIPKGEPENFISTEELMEKFASLASPYMEPVALNDLALGLLELDAVNSVSGLLHHGRQNEAVI